MNDNLFTPDCIRTHTGLYINVFKPTPEMVCIEDIAHGLSHVCRFAGQTPKFYSVAQHCILMSELAPTSLKFEVLMHDASEAYLGDMPKPIKNRMDFYSQIEDGLMRVIAKKFGFQYPISKEVKVLDQYMLEWEWSRLMLESDRYLGPVSGVPPHMAKLIFLNKAKLYMPAFPSKFIN